MVPACRALSPAGFRGRLNVFPLAKPSPELLPHTGCGLRGLGESSQRILLLPEDVGKQLGTLFGVRFWWVIGSARGHDCDLPGASTMGRKRGQ